MKFSIIIPAYNVADYLEKCVKSVLIQEFKDYEILIINDGSTDATAIVADKLSVENTNKVRVLNQLQKQEIQVLSLPGESTYCF